MLFFLHNLSLIEMTSEILQAITEGIFENNLSITDYGLSPITTGTGISLNN